MTALGVLPQTLPQATFHSVHEVLAFVSRGPWTTKSGGELNVLLAFPQTELSKWFFVHDEAELACVPTDIRGLRLYSIADIPKGGMGGTEFHRLRVEIVIATQGSVQWVFEDILGHQLHRTIVSGDGVLIPSFVLHTFKALEDHSELLVVCNTLFDPQDRRTHDSYPREVFRKLQEKAGARHHGVK